LPDRIAPHIAQVNKAATRTERLSRCQRAVEYQARHGVSCRRRTVLLTVSSASGRSRVDAATNRDGIDRSRAMQPPNVWK
jgi:hypothetical protein